MCLLMHAAIEVAPYYQSNNEDVPGLCILPLQNRIFVAPEMAML